MPVLRSNALDFNLDIKANPPPSRQKGLFVPASSSHGRVSGIMDLDPFVPPKNQ